MKAFLYGASLLACASVMTSAAAAKDIVVGVSWSNFQEERWKTDEAATKGALVAKGAKYISADAQGSPTKRLIAYAVLSTRQGQIASDGDSRRGSPFARAFAPVLPMPGQRIEDAYARIRERVKAETSGAQVPDVIRSDLPVGGVVLSGKGPRSGRNGDI